MKAWWLAFSLYPDFRPASSVVAHQWGQALIVSCTGFLLARGW